VELDDGRTAFVKLALDEMAAESLRDEHRVYSELDAMFLPRFLGWHDDEETLLALEDLSDAHWPPPWQPGQIEQVLATLERVAATPAPPGLPTLESLRERLNGWELVAEDPEPILSTGLVTASGSRAPYRRCGKRGNLRPLRRRAAPPRRSQRQPLLP
jgi:hypothetical protein